MNKKVLIFTGSRADYGLLKNPQHAAISINSFILDTTKVSWIASKDERYVVPMITFYNSNNKPRTFQTSNYLGVRSYLTFTLNTGGLSSREELEIYHGKQIIR